MVSFATKTEHFIRLIYSKYLFINLFLSLIGLVKYNTCYALLIKCAAKVRYLYELCKQNEIKLLKFYFTCVLSSCYIMFIFVVSV